MAIFHLSVKPISRSAGRSATAAAAYRSACRVLDERTGELHDYRRKGGVMSTDVVLAPGAPEWALDRERLWNAAEAAERRKDACVAREYEVALPAELSVGERRRLVLDFARGMAEREGCAVDVSIHRPDRGGDQRNYHAHILRTTRRVEADGLGAKLDTEKAGRNRLADLAAVRARWSELANQRLRENQVEARIDHRSLAEQGVKREPTRHFGPAATGYERRTGEPSDKRLTREREAAERLRLAKEAGDLERQGHVVRHSILDLSGDLEAARAERERSLRLSTAAQTRAAGVAGASGAARPASRPILSEQEVERGKQQAMEGFRRWKAEQDQRQAVEQAVQARVDQAKALAAERERTHQALEAQAKQIEGERQRQIELKRVQERKRDRGWSR